MKYPIGIQNFEEIINGGYGYVDKTAMVWRMVTQGKYYFLSRPRRFGKSLLLSTLEAYFEGKRELFDGLAIAGLEKEWKRYPVLHLDLNAAQYRTGNDLVKILNKHLEQWEALYGDKFKDRDPEERFIHVIEQAHERTGMHVAILVDEYDKPLTNNLGNETLQEEYRSLLLAFYSVLKSADRHIHFAILAGLTNFYRVSAFSGLNNLNDISMSTDFTASCGMTGQEIRDNFDGGVGELAEACRMTREECYEALRRRYDGYHFREDSVGMYNPFSVLNTLNERAFADYWFSTGTPTLLVDLLKQTEFNLYDITDSTVTADLLGSVDSLRGNPLPIIYQSGYLTIKGYDREFREYHLGFPNEEVESGFINYLLPVYTNARRSLTQFSVAHFVREVRGGQAEAFMTRLSAMMADTNNLIVGDAELYFQNFLFVFFRLLGLYVEVERATSDGRTDMVVQTPGYVYIFEFKLDRSVDDALRQIEEKGYARPFAADPRTLYKIGVSFSSTKRCVEE